MPRLILPRTYWADRIIFAVLLTTAAWLSLTLAREPGELAAVWVGNGIVTGWLLSRRTATWPGYLLVALLAELPVRMLAGDEPSYALALAACNQLEVLVVAGTVRRLVPDVRDPRNWMRLGGIATTSTLAACTLAGGLAAAVSHVLHGQPFLSALALWLPAHVVGMVLVATTTLVAHREGVGLFVAPGRRWSLAGSLALVVAVATGVFLSDHSVLFLTYPPLLLAAVRHRFVGAALGVVVLAVVAGIATSLGSGPLWQQALDGHGRIALLQLYLAGACLITIPVSLTMNERDRLAASLRDSERRYRTLADHSHEALVRISVDGERAYISPSASEMVGWAPDELQGSHWDVVHPDDRERQQQIVADVLASGEPRTDIYRLRHKDGRTIWVEAVTLRIPAEDGDGYDLLITARDINLRVEAEQALAESLRELEWLARVDPLTDLPNRRQFEERLDLALKRLHRHGGQVALLCLDIDRFKSINDTHGHAAGDAVLHAFGQRLYECVRETDLVARLGGDEFVILLEEEAPHGAEEVARKVVASMGAPVDAGGVQIPVATSIGVAYTARPIDPAALIAQADAALYAAKNAGRNRYHVATPD